TSNLASSCLLVRTACLVCLLRAALCTLLSLHSICLCSIFLGGAFLGCILLCCFCLSCSFFPGISSGSAAACQRCSQHCSKQKCCVFLLICHIISSLSCLLSYSTRSTINPLTIEKSIT